MSEIIYKVKRWLVHKLGGYMLDECVVNPAKIESLCMTHTYTDLDLHMSPYRCHERETVAAVSKFLNGIRKYIVVDKTRDREAETWTLRLRLRVINDFDGGNNNE